MYAHITHDIIQFSLRARGKGENYTDEVENDILYILKYEEKFKISRGNERVIRVKFRKFTSHFGVYFFFIIA